MRVLAEEPERRPEAREIDSPLESTQGILGGLIQAIYLTSAEQEFAQQGRIHSEADNFTVVKFSAVSAADDTE